MKDAINRKDAKIYTSSRAASIFLFVNEKLWQRSDRVELRDRFAAYTL